MLSRRIFALRERSHGFPGAFTSVADEIQQTDQLVRQIKAAMQEQNDGSQQITGTLRDMNASTQEVRSFAEDMAEGSKSILEEMRKLQDATGFMKSSMDEMAAGARKIHDTGSALGAISGEMKRTSATRDKTLSSRNAALILLKAVNLLADFCDGPLHLA